MYHNCLITNWFRMCGYRAALILFSSPTKFLTSYEIIHIAVYTEFTLVFLSQYYYFNTPKIPTSLKSLLARRIEPFNKNVTTFHYSWREYIILSSLWKTHWFDRKKQSASPEWFLANIMTVKILYKHEKSSQTSVHDVYV